MATKIKTVKKKSARRKWKLSPRQIAHRKYIRSKTWAAVKERFKKSEYYDGCCFICKKPGYLQIHHLTYERFGGKEIPSDLVALCGRCHKNIHLSEKKGIPFSKIIEQLRDLGLVSIRIQ